jgi:hypothetical protein
MSWPGEMTATEGSIDDVASLLNSSIYSKAEARKIVRLEIRFNMPMQIRRAYCFGVKSVNREYAGDIDSLARNLLQKIEGMPSGSRDALMILASKTEPEPWSLHDPNSPAAKAFREKLHKVLTDLRGGCGDVLANDVGDDARRDRSKEICAGTAFDLIVGLDAGKPVNYDEASPLRVLAGLLYDYTDPPDLKHQCVAIIAHWRQMPAEQKQAHIDTLRAGWEKLTGIARKQSAASR